MPRSWQENKKILKIASSGMTSRRVGHGKSFGGTMDAG